MPPRIVTCETIGCVTEYDNFVCSVELLECYANNVVTLINATPPPPLSPLRKKGRRNVASCCSLS